MYLLQVNSAGWLQTNQRGESVTDRGGVIAALAECTEGFTYNNNNSFADCKPPLITIYSHVYPFILNLHKQKNTNNMQMQRQFAFNHLVVVVGHQL